LVGTLLAITIWAACTDSNWHLVGTGEHPHDPPFLALSFTDSDHGWGITPTALFETSDGGQKWISRLESSDGRRTFVSVNFVNRHNGFIVGAQGTGTERSPLIVRTIDGGKSWQDTSIPDRSMVTRGGLHGVGFCADLGWAVGVNVILDTTNGGQTWEMQRKNKDEVLFSVACLSASRACAVGQNGLILCTKDGGKTWVSQTSGTTDNLARIRFFGEDGWIVGGIAGKSVLLRTRDAGTNWQPQQLDISEALFDIYFSGTRGWIVGANGTLLQSTDGGQTWEPQVSSTKNNLMCLFFLSPHLGWAGGDKQTLLRFLE